MRGHWGNLGGLPEGGVEREAVCPGKTGRRDGRENHGMPAAALSHALHVHLLKLAFVFCCSVLGGGAEEAGFCLFVCVRVS